MLLPLFYFITATFQQTLVMHVEIVRGQLMKSNWKEIAKQLPVAAFILHQCPFIILLFNALKFSFIFFFLLRFFTITKKQTQQCSPALFFALSRDLA